jgi:hypothetical protein
MSTDYQFMRAINAVSHGRGGNAHPPRAGLRIVLWLEEKQGWTSSFGQQETDYQAQEDPRFLWKGKHRSIPLWVLEFDPEFEQHGYGGHADFIQVLAVDGHSATNFEVPTHYTKKTH